MLEKVLTYKKQIAIAAAIVVVVVIVYYVWKGITNKQVSVVDDRGNTVSFTPTEQAQAISLATRIYNDINSGWLFGHNFWGNLGRDEAAYDEMIKLSNAMFALVCKTYQETYKSSLIADLRAESSLGTNTRKLILGRAEALNIE